MANNKVSTQLKALDCKIEEFARLLEITDGVSSVDVAAVMVRSFHQTHTYRREARLHGASDLLRIVTALEKYRAFSAEALLKQLETAREGFYERDASATELDEADRQSEQRKRLRATRKRQRERTAA